MPRTTGTRTPSAKRVPHDLHRTPRTYSVTDEDQNVRDYPRCRFLVTDEGELVVIRVDANGFDDFIVALYADGGWHAIEAYDPLVEGPDEPPAFRAAHNVTPPPGA